MTDQELIQELRDYTHNFSKYPFNPGTASFAAYRLEQLIALAQNGQSAIDTNQKLSEKLRAAISDIKTAINEEVCCELCKNNVECKDKECPEYIEGVGATGENGAQYPDFKWSCLDFEYGTCPLLEKTPCGTCDLKNNWRWRYE